MIRFYEENHVFHLTTPNTSYVCGLTDSEWLGHLYYGKKLSDIGGMNLLFREREFPFTPRNNYRDKIRFHQIYPMEYPFSGTGDYREAGISVQNASGQSGCELRYLNHTIYHGKNTDPELPMTRGNEENCDTLEIVLCDTVPGIDVHLYYSAFQDVDAITRSVRIVNSGKEKLRLTRAMSAVLSLDIEDPEILTLHGTWGRERRIQTQTLKAGSIVTESLRGVTGAEDHPFLGILSKSATQTQGEVIGMNLVYSGNFLAKVQMDQMGKTRAVMGIHPEQFSWNLNPGEAFQTPECVLVYSDEGIGGMTRTFHDLYRQHLIAPRWLHEDRPVLVNNWEATGMKFDTEVLLRFAREAKKSGIEMLVMDDGWFGHRDDDSSSLGDWFADEKKLRGGLKKLVDEVHRMGLKFGMWFEPEMISEDSRLFREHPDWMFSLAGRKPGMAREQYVLDLTRQEVWDGVYSQIKKVLSSVRIDYVKWDMNRPLSDVGNTCLPPDRQGEILHRYVLALYRMQRQLLLDFPKLLLENCSSGGARFDPGMLYFSPQIWTSDDTDAIERLAIQEGTAIIYPLSAMGAHVSASPNNQTGRMTPFDTRAKVAMAGTFGYELDLGSLSEEDREQIPGQIALFRRVHPVVREGDYYRLASWRENHVRDAWMVVTKDKSLAYLTFVQVLAEPNKLGVRMKLQGLDPDSQYRVTCESAASRAVREGEDTAKAAELMQYGLMQGRTLMQAGIIIARMHGDYQALLFEIRRVDTI